MIITGSDIMVRLGTDKAVEKKLEAFPQVTFHGKSNSGTDLIVNFECGDQEELENLCRTIRDSIPEIVDIGHIYINFEDEIEKIKGGLS
jgi:hypothetical protein